MVHPTDNYPGFQPPDEIDFDVPVLVSLFIMFGVLFMLLVLMAIYAICIPEEEPSVYMDSSFFDPGKFDDSQHDQEFIAKFSKFERELYDRAIEFQRHNEPILKPVNTYNNEEDRQVIKDRGIQAFYFLPSINDIVTPEGEFLPSFLVNDKLDITFTKNNKSASSIMNFPLPNNHRDAVYFEVKVFRHLGKSNSIFSIGLVTPPYPYFRLPGYNNFSIAYESTGKLRINNPCYANTLLPKLVEGDVVGFGYRYRTGSIFITHNGKKMIDVTHNVRLDLFIGIGAMNASYTYTYTRCGLEEDPDTDFYNPKHSGDLESGPIGKPVLSPSLEYAHDIKEEVPSDEVELHVNLGQAGFVFIEANVKKYAFGSVFGDIGIPPVYGVAKEDKLVEQGEVLPPVYPEDDIGFFGYSQSADAGASRDITRTGKTSSSLPETSVGPSSNVHLSSAFQDHTQRNTPVSKLGSSQCTESASSSESNDGSEHNPITGATT